MYKYFKESKLQMSTGEKIMPKTYEAFYNDKKGRLLLKKLDEILDRYNDEKIDKEDMINVCGKLVQELDKLAR